MLLLLVMKLDSVEDGVSNEIFPKVQKSDSDELMTVMSEIMQKDDRLIFLFVLLFVENLC